MGVRTGGGIALICAPSNLGLRPPAPGAVPGTAKAPEALREAGLFEAFTRRGAVEAGLVLTGRYLDGPNPAARRLRNHDALLDHTGRLAHRVELVLDGGRSPLILGGDCSILLGPALALRRRGRFGLIHIDGHTDFRHPGNSDSCSALAGEDLAAAIGLHWPSVADIDGLAPYVRPTDTVHIGCRDDDEHLDEVRSLLGAVIPTSDVRASPASAAHTALEAVAGAEGFWLHLDVDVLDPSVMPAVDSPAPGGLTTDELTELLTVLSPYALGAQVTVFDPDLDPDGAFADRLASVLLDGLSDLGTHHRPHE